MGAKKTKKNPSINEYERRTLAMMNLSNFRWKLSIMGLKLLPKARAT